MATSNNQEGIFATELKSLVQKASAKRLDELRKLYQYKAVKTGYNSPAYVDVLEYLESLKNPNSTMPELSLVEQLESFGNQLEPLTMHQLNATVQPDTLLKNKLNTLKGKVNIDAHGSKIPIIKDPTTYGSNKNLPHDCIKLPVDKALDAFEQELTLTMTHNPSVFTLYETIYLEDIGTDHYILKSLIVCIQLLLRKINIDEINYNNLYRICNLICCINMLIQERPSHITQNCIIINEGNVGVSDNELLGITKTFSSICLAIKDVETGKVYLAYINEFATKESIEKTISHVFPHSNNLIARLFDGSISRGNYPTDESIRKIINALPNHIKIISADIANRELNLYDNPYLSSSFVINPQTFEVINSYPISLTHNYISYIERKNLSYPFSSHQELSISYIDGHHIPLLLKDNLIQENTHPNFQLLLNQKLSALLNHISTTRAINSKLDSCFPSQILLALEIKTVIDSLMQKVQDTAKEKYIQLSEQNIDLIVKTLSSINLYIGPNACEANKPIFDFIENHLFKNGNTLDLEGLSKIQVEKDISNPTAEDMELPVTAMKELSLENARKSPVEDMELPVTAMKELSLKNAIKSPVEDMELSVN